MPRTARIGSRQLLDRAIPNVQIPTEQAEPPANIESMSKLAPNVPDPLKHVSGDLISDILDLMGQFSFWIAQKRPLFLKKFGRPVEQFHFPAPTRESDRVTILLQNRHPYHAPPRIPSHAIGRFNFIMDSFEIHVQQDASPSGHFKMVDCKLGTLNGRLSVVRPFQR